MKRQYKNIITLTNQEKSQLIEITKKGKHSVRVVKRASVLLKSESGLIDEEIASRAEISKSTVERIRARFSEGGIDRALYDAPRTGQPAKITAKVEAHLVAVACSNPPEGRIKWTLELLQKRLVKDKKIKSISKVAIFKHLSKRGIKPWLEKNVVHSENNGRI